MCRRVLIVDDNSAFREAARQLLERSGFVVVAEAESGSSAVQEAKTHRPDVALVDLQLPDFDGFEVAERLCRLDPAPRVILTSSLDGSDFGALITGSPALGFIPEGRAVGRRDRNAARIRRADPASRPSRRGFPRHSLASTSSITIRSRTRARRSASSSPTTPCFCARASPVCSSARDSRSWARAARPRICC